MDTLTVLMAEQDSEDKDAMLEFAKQWDVLDIVGVASNAAAAIFSVIEHKPDAIILDLGLVSGGGSFSFLYMLKEIGLSHKPYILAASANNNENTRREAAKLGVKYFVSKVMREDWRHFAVDALASFSYSIIQRRNLQRKREGTYEPADHSIG